MTEYAIALGTFDGMHKGHISVIKAAREKFDYILIDCPPLGSVIDAAVVSQVCDGMCLVLTANEISYKFAQKVKEQMDKTECRILGVILNKVKELLASYNAIITPACGKTSYEKYDLNDAFAKIYEESVFTAIPSITGLPAMVSGGVQLIADSFKESTLLSIAHSVEKEEA